ncbi:MAG: flagellar basal body P-ring protein FlgI, partial [Pirellulales bacterium]
MNMIRKITTFILLACIASTAIAQDSRSIRLADLCRVKGQEENRLQGLGLVMGLKGTGDNKLLPMTRQLASMVQKMGGSIAADKQGVPVAKELEAATNVALVMVTATIPATGAQQGDLLDCSVDAILAKSLQGGRLVLAYMLGPRADVPTVYGIASGQVTIPDITLPTAGTVHGGCKMETTVTNAFVQQNKMTLVINSEYASFAMAADIQDAINNLNSGMSAGNYSLAKAVDQSHIVVEVPPAYSDDPVRFAKLIMDVQLTNLKQSKRVVINEREGVIVIGENVVINPVAINHKNLTIQAGVGREPFVSFDPSN